MGDNYRAIRVNSIAVEQSVSELYKGESWVACSFFVVQYVHSFIFGEKPLQQSN